VGTVVPVDGRAERSLVPPSLDRDGRASTGRPQRRGSIYDLLDDSTSRCCQYGGCFSAGGHQGRELAREAFETNAVKLEVIGDDGTLLPIHRDAARPTCSCGRFECGLHSDDPVVAQRLEQVGCVAVMPSFTDRVGLGVRNPTHLDDRERVSVPVLLDAGVGTASDAASHGTRCDGVLAASAINRALDPVMMAEALRDAVRLVPADARPYSPRYTPKRRRLPGRQIYLWIESGRNYTRVVRRVSLTGLVGRKDKTDSLKNDLVADGMPPHGVTYRQLDYWRVPIS